MINRIARSVLLAVNAPSNVVGAIKAVGTGTVGFVRSIRAEMDAIEDAREDEAIRAGAQAIIDTHGVYHAAELGIDVGAMGYDYEEARSAHAAEA